MTTPAGPAVRPHLQPATCPGVTLVLGCPAAAHAGGQEGHLMITGQMATITPGDGGNAGRLRDRAAELEKCRG